MTDYINSYVIQNETTGGVPVEYEIHDERVPEITSADINKVLSVNSSQELEWSTNESGLKYVEEEQAPWSIPVVIGDDESTIWNLLGPSGTDGMFAISDSQVAYFDSYDQQWYTQNIASILPNDWHPNKISLDGDSYIWNSIGYGDNYTIGFTHPEWILSEESTLEECLLIYNDSLQKTWIAGMSCDYGYILESSDGNCLVFSSETEIGSYIDNPFVDQCFYPMAQVNGLDIVLANSKMYQASVDSETTSFKWEAVGDIPGTTYSPQTLSSVMAIDENGSSNLYFGSSDGKIAKLTMQEDETTETVTFSESILLDTTLSCIDQLIPIYNEEEWTHTEVELSFVAFDKTQQKIIYIQYDSEEEGFKIVKTVTLPESETNIDNICMLFNDTNEAIVNILIDNKLSTIDLNDEFVVVKKLVQENTDKTNAVKTLLIDEDKNLPIGGTENQVLYKVDSTNYNVGWKTIKEVPTGGTENQVLTKTNSGYDWKDSDSVPEISLSNDQYNSINNNGYCLATEEQQTILATVDKDLILKYTDTTVGIDYADMISCSISTRDEGTLIQGLSTFNGLPEEQPFFGFYLFSYTTSDHKIYRTYSTFPIPDFSEDCGKTLMMDFYGNMVYGHDGTKQDELTAGDGIDIDEDNVISCTIISEEYTAGDGIDIDEDNVISINAFILPTGEDAGKILMVNSDGNAVWTTVENVEGSNY